MRPNFVAIPRTNGDPPAVIRADQITAMLPQSATPKRPAETLIQLGPTITIHTPLNIRQVKDVVQQAIGLPMTIFEADPVTPEAA